MCPASVDSNKILESRMEFEYLKLKWNELAQKKILSRILHWLGNIKFMVFLLFLAVWSHVEWMVDANDLWAHLRLAVVDVDVVVMGEYF